MDCVVNGRETCRYPCSYPGLPANISLHPLAFDGTFNIQLCFTHNSFFHVPFLLRLALRTRSRSLARLASNGTAGGGLNAAAAADAAADDPPSALPIVRP